MCKLMLVQAGQDPGKGERKKVFIFGLGHITKMAAMPKNGEKLKKLSPEPLGRLS